MIDASSIIELRSVHGQASMRFVKFALCTTIAIFATFVLLVKFAIFAQLMIFARLTPATNLPYSH